MWSKSYIEDKQKDSVQIQVYSYNHIKKEDISQRLDAGRPTAEAKNGINIESCIKLMHQKWNQ